jgi:hypothetical protein
VVKTKRVRGGLTHCQLLDPHVLIGIGVQHHRGGGRRTTKAAREHARTVGFRSRAFKDRTPIGGATELPRYGYRSRRRRARKR